ncbi:MAG: hypothetical protein LC753_11340 [Acidobacteria bacterium]|nr:hypothetical protein [Acidobacteriota bacterium]MCA1650838.1 hypothetical protein [Acidobacteriota bacterium]
MKRSTHRTFAGVLIVFAALALPSAQIANRPAPAPTVSAEQESWYLSGEPITFAGNLYYASGPQVHFNANEMIRSGAYRGVPLYTKTTVEPYSMVFVPISGGLLRPYERRRSGDVAGTVGSTTPSFPVVLPAEERLSEDTLLQAPVPPTGLESEPVRGYDVPEPVGDATPAPVSSAVGTGGPAAVAASVYHSPLQSAQKPRGLNGVFIPYNGRHWFSSGAAVAFQSLRFVQIGEYKGFPVYADKGQETDTIYVPFARGPITAVSPFSVRK